MKLPKTVRMYCPKCNAYTEHIVMQSKKRAKNSTHPLSKGSKKRVKERGQWRGHGNHGKYSKPAVKSKKLTKKTDLRFVCKECKYTLTQAKGIRLKKVEIV